MPVRRVQIGPSRVRARGAVHGETCTTCSQMPGFQSRILALVVHLRLPHLHARSTWNDPEALASRPPLPRCVRFKSLRLPALLTQRSHRPKSTLRVAEARFPMLLHALVKWGEDLSAAERLSPLLTWDERLSVEKNGRMSFAKTGIYLFPVPRSASLASHDDRALRVSAVFFCSERCWRVWLTPEILQIRELPFPRAEAFACEFHIAEKSLL